ncbi:MAG TPA: hypothetical protein VFZ53_32345 [Polyangiaceae bacterium]
MELRLGFVLALFLAACRPEIGDPCETSVDCSPVGDRICDITQEPTGYCTIFNCEPDECPEEAVCVKFGNERSPLEGCDDPLGAGPYARTYCLKKCKKNNDCRERDGYKCLDPRSAWNAEVIDHPFSRICGLPPKVKNPLPKINEGGEDPDGEGGAPPLPGRSNDVCTGEITPSTGGAPSGGSAGAGPGGAGG